MNNLSVISDMKIKDLNGEENSQIYALCAAGTRSTIRVLRHGLEVNAIGESPLHGTPNVKKQIQKREKKCILDYIRTTRNKVPINVIIRKKPN
jgi:hypothetical protein